MRIGRCAWFSSALIAATGCVACGSPANPSSLAAQFELRITESPICKTLTAGTPNLRYGFFSMSTHSLVRAGAAAAIAAGVLRAASSFVAGAGSETQRQALYVVIDFLLLLGVIAAFAQNHRSIGRWGTGGFLVAVAGILLVRSSRAIPGVDLYPAGALTVAIGCMMFSAVLWRRANGSPVVPLLFAVSVATGLAGQATDRAQLFVASGVIFGVAMIGVGGQILSTIERPRRAGGGEPEHRENQNR